MSEQLFQFDPQREGLRVGFKLLLFSFTFFSFFVLFFIKSLFGKDIYFHLKSHQTKGFLKEFFEVLRKGKINDVFNCSLGCIFCSLYSFQ